MTSSLYHISKVLKASQTAHWLLLFFFSFVVHLATFAQPHPDCFEKNDYTITFLDCGTIQVNGNPVANSHEWNFGGGWFTGNAQEVFIFPCNGTYTVQHTVEGGPAICEKEVIISCEGFTIEENEDECLGDFACFRYISNYCPTDQLTWDFGDGNVITCTGCATVEHCYTNVNTFNGTNTQVMPSVTVNGQIFCRTSTFQTMMWASSLASTMTFQI